MSRKEANVLDAAAQGAANAVMLVLNIIANLIAFLAFVAFLDAVVSWSAGLVGAPYVTFQVCRNHTICSLYGHVLPLDQVESVPE